MRFVHYIIPPPMSSFCAALRKKKYRYGRFRVKRLPRSYATKYARHAAGGKTPIAICNASGIALSGFSATEEANDIATVREHSLIKYYGMPNEKIRALQIDGKPRTTERTGDSKNKHPRAVQHTARGC